jgi:penicillin-binding protein 1A
MDPYNGKIVALSGGTGEKTQNFGWNHATDARRPAGSSFKPVAVYGPAFDLGLITQSTKVLDADGTKIKLSGTSWYPRNSGGGYRGPTTIRQALISSLNTVSAQIMDKLTPAVSFEYLTTRLGFTLVDADRTTRLFHGPAHKRRDGARDGTGFHAVANSGTSPTRGSYTAYRLRRQ